eukprot:768538-Hanusia_phi.AAC.2
MPGVGGGLTLNIGDGDWSIESCQLKLVPDALPNTSSPLPQSDSWALDRSACGERQGDELEAEAKSPCCSQGSLCLTAHYLLSSSEPSARMGERREKLDDSE